MSVLFGKKLKKTSVNKDLKYIPFVEKTERVSLGDDELPPPDQTDMDLN